MSRLLDTATLAALLAGWFGFLAIFVADRIRQRGRGEARAVKARTGAAVAGLLLQGVGFALVWAIRRPAPVPDPSGWPGAAAGPAALRFALVVLLVAGSCALVLAAVRRLGKQWSLAARVVEGHELVQEGPFRIVRHPIYLGMGGFLLATGIALAPLWALGAAVALYLAGTRLRVTTEERLLAETFGPAFAAYRAVVPGFLPGRSPAIPTPSLALGAFASATFALMHAALAAVALPGDGLFAASGELSFLLDPMSSAPGPLILATSSTGATVFAAALFAVFAVYGLAGSGLLTWQPPLLRFGLAVVTAVYLLRGLAFVAQFYWFYKTLGGDLLLWSWSLTLAFATVGLIHLIGTISAWKRLRRAGPG